MISRILFSITVFTGLIACSGGEEQKQESVTEVAAVVVQESKLIDTKQFEIKMVEQNTVILDVRTPRETANGVIEGAVILDYNDSDFRAQIANLDKDKTYLVYCASGGRSKNTQKYMDELGFSSVYDLKGGIRAWQREGKALVQIDN